MVGMSVINTIMGSSGGGLMSLFLTHLQAQYIDKTVISKFFVRLIFWFLVTVGNKVTKIQK